MDRVEGSGGSAGAGCVDLGVEIRRAQHEVAQFNVGHQRQSKNLLERYQQMRVQGQDFHCAFVKPAAAGVGVIEVGKSYAMLFQSGPVQRPVVEVFVGHVRALISTSPKCKAHTHTSGAAAKKGSYKPFIAVPRDDVQALYFCHPYAKVALHGDVVGLQVYKVLHRWYPLVEGTSADQLLDSGDADSDSEYESEEEAAVSNAGCRREEHLQATNVQEEVLVDWSGESPSVSDAASLSQLRALLQRAAGAGRPPLPPRGGPGRQQAGPGRGRQQASPERGRQQASPERGRQQASPGRSGQASRVEQQPPASEVVACPLQPVVTGKTRGLIGRKSTIPPKYLE